MKGTLTSKVRVIVISIIEPNHLKILIHIENKTNAINHVLSCQSLIAVRLLDIDNSIAEEMDFHSFNSSRSLSNIRTLASTAIPSDNITAAIPLRDRAKSINFRKANNITINIIIVHNAINDFLTLYINNIIKYIATIQITIASIDELNAFSHRVGLTFSSCIRINGAGKAQSFNEFTNSFAESEVNCQSICAHHQHILDCIVGAVNKFHHINIAI